MGSIYLDFRVDIDTSRKLLIYGHNSSNIDMPFTKIHRYIERKKINKMTKQGIFKVGEYYD